MGLSFHFGVTDLSLVVRAIAVNLQQGILVPSLAEDVDLWTLPLSLAEPCVFALHRRGHCCGFWAGGFDVS